MEITLSGTAANVRLVDASNLGRLKRGQQHRYTGGHYTRSPVRMPIPSNGQWHVVIDHGGNRGSTRAAVRVLPGNLPAGRTLKPSGNVRAGLEEIAGNVADLVEHSGDVIDVFISHAWEDKDAVARPLAAALRDRGLEVCSTSTPCRSATASAARSTTACVAADSASSSSRRPSSARAGRSTSWTVSSPFPSPAGRCCCRYGTTSPPISCVSTARRSLTRSP